MNTRSTRQTRSRALQEITNVEADVQKPASKRQRVVDSSSTEAPKPATRLTRRKSLEAESTQPPTVSSAVSHETLNLSCSSDEPKSQDQTNQLNVSLESISSSISSAKKIPRKRGKRADPTQCLEIISAMYDRFYQQEETFRVASYMSRHTDINQKMRSILVDWLVEVHFKFRLQAPTLWLCVNILDRYLSASVLPRNQLQLLGVSSLLVACKFEEIFPPEVQDCVYITDHAYSKEEVLKMEQSILKALDYQLCVPTGYHFMIRYLTLIHASEIVKYLAFYYSERNLQETDYLDHKPSLFAAAAVYAALVQQTNQQRIQQRRNGHLFHSGSESNDEGEHASIWPDILIEESGYDERDLLPIARIIIRHVSEEPVTTSMRRLIAAKKKYLNDKFHHIAELDLPVFPSLNTILITETTA